MLRAGRSLVGTRDFLPFSSLKRGRKSTVRTLLSFDVAGEGGALELLFRGDGFLYNMIRIITGTLLEVGAGTRPAQDVLRVLESGERTEAGPTAPAHGLCLLEVKY
jgi:tRNA pseudouridine38-40 synthase